MLHLVKLNRYSQLVPRKLALFRTVAFESTCQLRPSLEEEIEIERIIKIVNDHPFPDCPLHPTLLQHIPPSVLSTPLVENVLGRLFAAHSNGLKAFEFFKFSLQHSHFRPSSDAFEKTLHILARMRYFEKAWELMEEIQRTHPALLTLKSMSIMLSRISKFQTYEDTLEAFERMEEYIFVGRKFGTDEFNVLLRAFSTQRLMKEARSVFNKMHPRFSPNTKTMNILLLGFKESGDVTAVELFYHEMVRRGFKPNNVTYNIRIDAYCKKGCFGDGLRLLNEMERVNCFPTIETITTLIHGAGIAQNITKARELLDEIPMRNLRPDIGAYNALMSSLIRSRDVKSAFGLMDEMEEKGIGHDNITYHTMFFGIMRTKSLDSVSELYDKMMKKNFVPKTRTVVMLMRFFCENRRPDLGLNLWGYLLERGHCPHGHALDLLVTALCSYGRVQEAFDCSKQMLERGRQMSEAVFRMLERFLLQAGDMEKGAGHTATRNSCSLIQNLLGSGTEELKRMAISMSTLTSSFASLSFSSQISHKPHALSFARSKPLLSSSVVKTPRLVVVASTVAAPSPVDLETTNLMKYVKSRLPGGFAAQTIFGTGRRKCAIARVVLQEGNGKVIINYRDAKEYLQGNPLWIQYVKFPLMALGYESNYDVFVKAHGGGLSGQAQAISLGIARALLKVSENHRTPLRKEGLLTRDSRVVERKKVGLKKARKAPQFSKR